MGISNITSSRPNIIHHPLFTICILPPNSVKYIFKYILLLQYFLYFAFIYGTPDLIIFASVIVVFFPIYFSYDKMLSFLIPTGLSNSLLWTCFSWWKKKSLQLKSHAHTTPPTYPSFSIFLLTPCIGLPSHSLKILAAVSMLIFNILPATLLISISRCIVFVRAYSNSSLTFFLNTC